MDVTTGEGLDILITCERTWLQNWMSFASWYSLSVNLPDANVVVGCMRSVQKHLLLDWPNRVGVDFFQYNENADPVKIALGRGHIKSDNPIILPPHVMAVREYSPDFTKPADVRSNEYVPFVYYHEGCGKFVVTEWIDKLYTPFEGATKRFGDGDMSINEIAVLKLWDRMHAAARGTL